MKKLGLFILVIGFLAGCKEHQKEPAKTEVPHTTNTKTSATPIVSQKKDLQLREVNFTKKAPKIDGIPDDETWKDQSWNALDQNWIGEDYTPEDFEGHYKMTWDKTALYLLVKVKDDSLIDVHNDPFKQWWDDDGLEVFIDEDNSGGAHQYSYNAFSYHVALNGNVVDYGTDKKPHLYNDHVVSAHKSEGKTTYWELKVSVYSDQFSYRKNDASPEELTTGKKIGFALAYCDIDTSKTRENFIGSVPIPDENKNPGQLDADVFGTIVLK